MDPAGYNGTAGSPVPSEQPQAGQADGSSSFSVPAPPPPVMVDAGQGSAWGQPAETNGHGLLPLSTSSDAPLNLQDSAAGTSIDTTQFFSQAQGAPSSSSWPGTSQQTTIPSDSQTSKPKKKKDALPNNAGGLAPALALDPALVQNGSGSVSPMPPTPADATIAPVAAATAVAAAETNEPVKKESNDEEVLDVMTGAGIDLKAEQDAIGRSTGPGGAASSSNATAGSFTTRAPPPRAGADPTSGGLFMNIYDLSFRVHRIAFKHQLQVDPDVLNYLSLATRQRLRNLLEVSIAASRHRNWSHHLSEPGFWPDRKGKRRRLDTEEGRDAMDLDAEGKEKLPLFKREVVSDLEAQLSAIEKADRHQDVRAKQRRKERDERMQAATQQGAEASGSVIGDAAGSSALEARKGGVTDFKHASADVSKKLADSIANTAFGGGGSKYSWLSSGVSGLGLNKSKGLAGAGGSGGASPAAETPEVGTPSGGLPKPRFQPAPPITSTADGSSTGGWSAAAARLRTGDGEGSGKWSDLTARQQQQAEEEKLERSKVTLDDALQALERERAGGAGPGSGALTLYRTQALGRPRRALKK